MPEETLYAMALSRMSGFNLQTALLLYRKLGSAKAVYEHRADIADIVPDCSPRLTEALRHWDEALSRAEAELQFTERYNVRALTLNDPDYPERLRLCDDAPIILYYRGSAQLNQLRIISMVGTRHCTLYGQDQVRRFVSELKELCPQALIVSGLAYGIDICAHRQALQCGYETVGVLAHGLDTIYPSHHRDTATQMVQHGGLLTEYMSQTEPLPNNFRQRNRIVAGISDATIVVESATKGGALITARIASDYSRDVFAFPGNVGARFSEGCNNLIRQNKAALVTSAHDFLEDMGWLTDAVMQRAKRDGIERNCFPSLTEEEQAVVRVLDETGDLQQNILSVKTNLPASKLTALLFQLELKGVIKAFAGGTYHLLT